jgi:hypothetical protein
MQTYRFFLQLTKDIGNYKPWQVKQFHRCFPYHIIYYAPLYH